MNPIYSCLYAISGEKLSLDYLNSPVETISQAVDPQQELVLADFLSPVGFVLFPGIWDVKVTLRATGNQPNTYAFYRVEVLQNGEQVAITDYQHLTDSFQSLTSEIFLPGHKYTDRLTLKVWVKNAHNNVHTNTFELQVNQNKSFLKK